MRSAYLLFGLILFSCTSKINSDSSQLYFPDASIWESTNPNELRWNVSKTSELFNLLEAKNTKGFIILKNGKIVIEKYWGKDLLGNNDFDQNSAWYWASAGKTLTAAMVGIAEQENHLSLNDKSSTFLGQNWTSLNTNQEDNITIWNHLTMTTGLDDGVPNSDSFKPEDLKFKSDAGTRWAYHNAPYTILDEVLMKSTNSSFDDYFDQKIKTKIGMDGQWRWIGNNHVYFSTVRSMAKFGLLILNNGQWKEEMVVNETFVKEMTTTSQELNKSYGYLWWLNGKDSFMLPQNQRVIAGSLVTNAPADAIMGLGKNGQFLCIVPSENIVLVRMGEDPDDAPVSTIFLNEIWAIMNEIIK